MLPIYSILNSDPDVRAFLYDGTRLRAWGFGYASQSDIASGPDVQPYVVYQVPSDEPDNLLTCDPTHSAMIYQFDVYGRDGNVLGPINSALQYALKQRGQIHTIRHPVFEPDSELYRAGFDFHYLQMR